MNEFVIQSNIERFEKLLASEADAGKANILRGLLANERAKAVAVHRSEIGPIQAAPKISKP
ncbi:hypothetical protein [Novosphingobium sp. BL-52-GroH]|uniref:hypothetical protein n=1 Tax=Novosphingobium sp. BL-52-GroH TaxID=3349877 RepID=UPI00384D312D